MIDDKISMAKGFVFFFERRVGKNSF